MKRSGWTKRVALAVCACAIAGTAATAQVTIGWGSSNAVQSSLGSSSGYAVGSMGAADSRVAPAGSDVVGGAFVINRFGVRDGRIVAYGRLVPVMGAELDASASTGSMVSRSGMLLSSPAEPAGGYGADPRLGMGSRIAYSDVIVGSPASSSNVSSSFSASGVSVDAARSSANSVGASARWGVNESFDESRLGAWTGIGTGYGESGAEARSTMTRDVEEETTAFNLGRPYDDQSYMEDITWEGHATLNDDLALSEDQEMLGDLELSVSEPVSIESTVSVVTPGALDRGTTLSLAARRPLVQLGGSAGLYESAEAERALMLGSSEDIAIPVSVVSASCDAVSLSFSGVETMTVRATSADGRLGSTLCALSEATSLSLNEGRQAKLLKHLNRLISDVE